MDITTDQDLTLPVLFHNCWVAHENGDSLTDAEIEEAVRWLQKCSRLVATLGLFSSNEQAEDIATADLKYLLVPFLLGDILSRSRTQGLHRRVGLLNDALQLLRGFMEQLKQYGLLGRDESAVLMEAQGQASLDPGTRRAQKVARFRMEKAAKAKLVALRTQELRKRRLRELEAGEEGGLPGSDEDVERDVWLTQIQLCTLTAADALGSLKREIEVLSHAATLSEDERARPAEPPPAEVMQQLHKAAAALSTGRAEQMRASVFRPSHNLPTITLAEQAEREMVMAQRASEAQARAEAQRARERAEDKDGDAETLRQRTWDDWKDENPRGAGNSKLLPTA
ncbi:g4376 [Coccomyxa elongata]